ncbi:acyl-CoA dehydrogenase family protein [Sphingobium sp.]|uniref:acyl-CoA dehydrogenase family protein n=1 Tax=Sphingobium sp. TaxID=1912891 RepID=UPI003B3B9F72
MQTSSQAVPNARTQQSEAIDYLSIVKDMAPLVNREARAAEEQGDLTAPVVDLFLDTQLVWFMTPHELGGGGASIRTCIEVLEELARSDGSTGWSLMATSIHTLYASGWAGDQVIDAMFGGGERAIVAGMPGPIGKATRQADGQFRGSGRFGFASGSGYANWFLAGMTLVDDGGVPLMANGEPQTLTFFLPRDRITYVRNWDVLGLKATASNDFIVNDEVVSPDYATNVRTFTPLRGPDRYRMGGLAFGAAGHCAVVLGMMKRALEEIAVIASGKSRLGYGGPIGKYPTFQKDFATQEAIYTAVRTRVIDIFEDLERCAEAGDAPTAAQWARMYQFVAWVHDVGPEVVRNCHAWAGSSGIREPSVIGRYLRDSSTARMHSVADPIKLVNAAPHLIELYADRSRDRA